MATNHPASPRRPAFQSARPFQNRLHKATTTSAETPAGAVEAGPVAETAHHVHQWTRSRARAVRINAPRPSYRRRAEMIERFGFEGLPRDSVKHLEEKLWELRIAGRDGISRAIYITATGRRVVILRVFIKKSQQTPSRELQLARQRAKEVR